MKNPLRIIALFSLVSYSAFGAPEPKDNTPDSPGESPVSASLPSAKSKRPNAQTNRRHPTTAEIKTFSFNRSFGADRASRPMVIRTGKVDAKVTSQLQEDLAVMSRILEKSAAEYRDEHEEAAGIPILALGAGKAIRATYLEDYGVMFTLNVNIPLKAEPKVEEADEKAQGANEEWTEARNELFGDRRGAAVRGEKFNRRPFDAHQVDEFRIAMVDALRNASNIRNLKDTDWITLVVRGRGSDSDLDGPLDIVVRGGGTSGRENYTAIPASAEDRLTDGSTLVMRIRKSALDELTRQKGSVDQLKQKLSISVY